MIDRGCAWMPARLIENEGETPVNKLLAVSMMLLLAAGCSDSGAATAEAAKADPIGVAEQLAKKVCECKDKECVEQAGKDARAAQSELAKKLDSLKALSKNEDKAKAQKAMADAKTLSGHMMRAGGCVDTIKNAKKK